MKTKNRFLKRNSKGSAILEVMICVLVIIMALAFLPAIGSGVLEGNIIKAVTLLDNNGYIVLASDNGQLSQSLIPSADNTYDLGSETNKWKAAYFNSDSLHIGDLSLEAIDGSLAINGNPVPVLPSNGNIGQVLGLDANGNFGWVDVTKGEVNELDPIFTNSIAYSINSGDISSWNSKLSSYTETDPLWVASVSHGITSGDITNWNAGYTYRLTSASGTAPLTLTLSANGLTGSVDLSAYETTSALGSWAGSSNLTTLGTITTGTWHGDAIGDSYISSSSTWNGKQSGSSILTGLAGLSYSSGSPIVRMNGASSFTLDTNTYLTGNQSISLDGDLSGSGTTSITGTVTGIEGHGITLAEGILRYYTIGGGFWGFDNTTYLTSNQSISLGGILSGSGTTSITASAASGYYMPSTSDQTNWNAKLSGVSVSAPLSGTGTGGSPLTIDLSAYETTSALGSWAGSANLATLGTITTGTWHGSAIADSYISSATTWSGKQAGSAILTALAGLSYSSGSPIVRMNGASSFTLDTATYLTGNQSISLGGDLSGSGTTSISATVGGIGGKAISLATGYLKYTGSAWSFDNSTFLTANQSISLSGDASGSGTTSIAVTNSGLKGIAIPALSTGYLYYNGSTWAFSNSTANTPTQYNQSTSSQGAGFATDTYLVGSSINIPAGGLKAGTIYHLIFDVSKTGAGTATPIIYIRFGTGGSTGDTARLTFTFTAGTAVADVGTFEVWATFRTVGSGTSAVIEGTAQCRHTASATTGLINKMDGTLQVTSGGFDSTVANSIIGASVNGGTSAAWTVQLVQAQLQNLP